MKNGFTLIEALLYIALFAIIIGGAMVGVYQIIESTNRTNERVMITAEGNFLQRKLDWALVGSSVDNALTDTDTLTLDKPGVGNLVFQFADPNITLNGTPLNNSFVAVTDPNIVYTPAEKKVDISFRVDGELFTQTKYLY